MLNSQANASNPPEQALYRGPFLPVGAICLISILALVFGVMRGIGTVGPSNLRWLLPLGFCVMALLPLLLLRPSGRKEIGLRMPTTVTHFSVAILCGAAAAVLCFLFGFLLYQYGPDNWYVSIANNYRSILDTSNMTFWMLTLVFTIPAILFSPIGEEIFFRGMLQTTLEQRLSVRASTAIECGLFGLVHLFHHGIHKTDTGLSFLPISGGLWVLQMVGVALLFAYLRKRSGSLYVAIIAHASFNLTMNTVIFLFLWK